MNEQEIFLKALAEELGADVAEELRGRVAVEDRERHDAARPKHPGHLPQRPR